MRNRIEDCVTNAVLERDLIAETRRVFLPVAKARPLPLLASQFYNSTRELVNDTDPCKLA